MKQIAHPVPTKQSIIGFVFTMIFCGVALATPFEETVSQGMKTLGVSKGDPQLLLMTNATYVMVDGAPALSYLDQAQNLTGCMVGKANLLFFQRTQSHPLRLMLFKKESGQAVVISLEDKAFVSEAMDLSPTSISQPAFWEKAKEFKAGKDMFTLAAIANVWAKGGPYDFLKSAELHNHICPGLTSGYLLAHYILNKYPLKEGERYTIVSSPVWCKEDALQVVLDCTPGKKGMVVKPLSKKQLEAVSVPNPAGMVLIWNEKQKSGKGVALSFNFDSIQSLSPKDTPKAATVLAAVDQLDHPEKFVSTGAEFDLTEALYDGITEAGSNPYELAGLVKK
jgi:formylmethanofuran dehydrogenase subunit E-like metal-binding protein